MHKLYTVLLLSVFLLPSCGGGGGGSSPPATTTPTPPQPDPPQRFDTVQTGRVAGPVVGATIKVYTLSDWDNPVCETTSADTSDLATAGTFELPNGCIHSNTVYQIVARGGELIDANNDGEIDTTPTTVKGAMRAYVTRDGLLYKDWHLSALTDSIRQAVVQIVRSDTNADTAQQYLDAVAASYLLNDINFDKAINNNDALFWDSTKHSDAVRNKSLIADALSAILDGNNLAFSDSRETPAFLPSPDMHQGLKPRLGDGILALPTRHGFAIYDTSQASLQLLSAVASTWRQDIELYGDFLLLAAGSDGLKIFDISEPSKPKLVSKLAQHSRDITIDGDYAFVSSYQLSENRTELLTVNLSNINEPVVENIYWLHSAVESRSIQIYRDHLYAIWHPGKTLFDVSGAKIGIFDISDPLNPVDTGTIINHSGSNNVAPTDYILFRNDSGYFQSFAVATEATRTLLYDVSQVASPTFIKDTAMPDGVMGVDLLGDKLYVATETALYTYQLPALTQLSRRSLPKNFYTISVDENYVYLLGNGLSRIGHE